MVVGRIFPGGVLGDFSEFFPGDTKTGEIFFFPIETKKITFFAKIFKIQGGLGTPCPPPFRRPWPYTLPMLSTSESHDLSHDNYDQNLLKITWMALGQHAWLITTTTFFPPQRFFNVLTTTTFFAITTTTFFRTSCNICSQPETSQWYSNLLCNTSAFQPEPTKYQCPCFVSSALSVSSG